jgi:hypothetical protein
MEADEQRQERRAGKGGGRDDPGLERAVAELEQIDRQQQADEAVANRPHAARCKQQTRFRRGAGWQGRKRCPHRAARDARDHANALTARK